MLRKRPEIFFVNLRQYLYTRNPNEETKDWIRELILNDHRYGATPYDREFFQLIKTSCEHFKDNFLSITEREKIFSKIIDGVVEKGSFYSSKDLHRTQLFPFVEILFGKYKSYFEGLIKDYDKNHSHIIYHYPEKVADHIFDYSPFAPQHLARYSDIELLELLNSWQNELTFSKDNCSIRISIVGLSKVFADVFSEHIVCNESRLDFWLTEGKKITRPIYTQEMLAVACRGIDQQTLTNWLSFGKWVLSHHEIKDPKAKNTSSNKPDWYYARFFVHQLMETIVKKEPALFKNHEQLDEILFLLSTQPSRDLDLTKTNDNYRQFDLGLNFTRSRSLLTLMKFVQKDNYYLKTLLKVFEKRFAEHNVSAPEQAVLGYMFPLLVELDEKIAENYRRKIFPPDEQELWHAAFEGLIGYHNPSELIYTTVDNEFEHYIENLQELRKRNHNNYALEDKLSDLFFYFYLHGKFSLPGKDSLLARYYQATNNDHDSWGKLFSRVGSALRYSNPSREQQTKIIAFLRWRVEHKDPQELSGFSAWLSVEWLEDNMFIQIAKEILPFIELKNVVVVNSWLGKLSSLLPSLVTDVVDCSWLLIKNLTEDVACYLHIEYVQAILSAGEKFADGDTRITARTIKAYLIKRGGLNIDDLTS